MSFDLGHITKCILEYDIGIPTSMIIGVFVCVCVAVLASFLLSTSYSAFVKFASICLFVGYLFLVLCTTILFREDTFLTRFYLCPLWSYTDLYDRMFSQNLLNVAMFVPIGFFAGGALKKKHIWNILGIGIVLSFFIELTQLITTRGVFNVDDIIHNTLGCVIGFGCFVFCYKLIRRIA